MGFVGSYVWSLRQHVGRAPLLVTGVGIFVTEPDGRIWLGRRTDSGDWCYFGGAMELGQGALDCVRDELREETGLSASDIKFVGLHSNPQETTYTYPNGDQVQIVNLLFEVPRNGQPLVLDDEHSEVAAFSLDALPTPLKPDARHSFRLYQAYRESGMVQMN